MWEEEQSVSPDNIMVTKSAPITLYKVSHEWLNNLMAKMKSEVMGKAIEHRCPPEFLDSVNSIELDIGDNSEPVLNSRASEVIAAPAPAASDEQPEAKEGEVVTKDD